MRARWGLVGCLCALGLGCGSIAGDPSGLGGKADRGEDTELLTAEQAQNVADAFDDVCGDTFCCGDLNYYMASVSCDSTTGVCDLRYDAQPYAEEDKYAADALDGFPPEALRREGGAGEKAYVGRVLEAVKDEDGVWIRVSCQLDGGYSAYSDLMDADSGHGDDLSWRLYDHFLDCLHAMEDALYKTIPAGPPPKADQHVVVEGTPSSTLVKIAVGDTLDVKLDGNPTTGYSWKPRSSSASLPLRSSWYDASEPQLIGSGGVYTFRYRATELSAGEHTLDFAYYRSWEGPEAAIETFALTVVVDAESEASAL